MVAAKWGWSTPHILGLIGWKAALAVLVNAMFSPKALIGVRHIEMLHSPGDY